jgi:lipopolysaccharide/colanic/teichoic acid biosynthesis glycosyltransferase
MVPFPSRGAPMKEKLRKHKFSIFFAVVWSFAGFALLSSAAVSWFPFIENSLVAPKAVPLLIAASAAYIVISFVLSWLRSFPYANRPYIVNFVATVASVVMFIALATARVYFSLSFLLLYVIFTNLWFLGEALLRSRFSLYVLAVIPGGYPIAEGVYQNTRLVLIDHPENLPQDVDGVVVDFHQELSAEWLAFVSRCVMEDVPVISTDDFLETQRGTIILENLTTAQSVTFQKASIYQSIKRLLDILIVIGSLPVWLAIFLITAICVKLESPGPLIFSQRRVGRRGKPFTVYKIRSMRTDAEKEGAAFAAKGDARVTRVGAFIRKYRIDEIPQFFNILRGDMSLIGPRPEQAKFVAEFEKSIPYFSLRHIVRPGISGWAQVTQGYAAGTDAAAIKLSHDLYYVKHLSFVLDFLIVIKTIATILTGFGSR